MATERYVFLMFAVKWKPVENDRKRLENNMFVDDFLEVENGSLMKCFPCVNC